MKHVELVGAVLGKFPGFGVVLLPADYDTAVRQGREEGNPLVLSSRRRINYNDERAKISLKVFKEFEGF